jgi:hypothetical protein
MRSGDKREEKEKETKTPKFQTTVYLFLSLPIS